LPFRYNLFRDDCFRLAVMKAALGLASKLRVGCSGWGYDDWVGPFYPPGTQKSEYLRQYATAFDLVEIDSSFYNLPSQATVSAWRRAVPDGFLFTAKFPKRITHDLKLVKVEEPLARVYKSMGELGEKLGMLVVQLPPSIRYDKHWDTVKAFVGLLDPKIHHAIEFRSQSWFREDVSDLLREHGVAMVWSHNQFMTTPAVVTTDFAYVRLVGGRDIDKFDRIVKDRSAEMKDWHSRLESVTSELARAFVILNNHYAGFSPASVNQFRRMAGLGEVAFPVSRSMQKSLSEF
jgi:uncharacterized protein YecE (DUF72 family)